jgi:O-antigen biosynthesis protein
MKNAQFMITNLAQKILKKTGVINKFSENNYSYEASNTSSWFDFKASDIELSQGVHNNNSGTIEIKRVIWFIPDFDNPYWGGIHTILRFASYFKEKENIENCFVLLGDIPEKKIRSLISSAFPSLKDVEICIIKGENELAQVKDADVSICTLWTTAYHSLKFNKVKRKFYFIQDYESLFYPAGSTSAQVEETYRFGFYGLTNTESLKQIYDNTYGGISEFFTPSVDPKIFFPGSSSKKSDKLTLFFYARPGHPRNGFELGITAIKKLKTRMGDRVRIVTAGAEWNPQEYGVEGVVENLGILSYQETANLYRKCDMGFIMMFTRHPSYLPLELMACGCLVITNYNPATTWLLHDQENCLLSAASASCLSDTMYSGLNDIELRKHIIMGGFDTVHRLKAWKNEIEKVYAYMCNPETIGKKIHDLPKENLNIENLTFGGERVTHLYPNDCYYAHLSIYAFASDYIKNKVILDAGCGAGYGTVYFADNGAKSVTGIDISRDAIQFTQQNLKRDNLKFQLMDLEKINGLKDHSYDVIFSSNALEHVNNVQAFFASAWELLKYDGILIIAIPPVVNEGSKNSNLSNPFHLNIWSPRQWVNVIDKYFINIKCYNHTFDGKELNFCNTPEQTIITEKNFKFEQIPIDQYYTDHSLTIILVAEKHRPVNELPDKNETIQMIENSFTRTSDNCIIQPSASPKS